MSFLCRSLHPYECMYAQLHTRHHEKYKDPLLIASLIIMEFDLGLTILIFHTDIHYLLPNNTELKKL